MMRRWTVIPIFIVFFALFPEIAYADNCSSLGDCFGTLRAAVAATVGLAIFATILSIGLDFIPIVGTAKGIIESITGRDLITGEELAKWERAMGIIPFVGAVPGLVKLGKLGDDLADASKAMDTVGEAGSSLKKVDYGDHYTKVDGKKALKPDIEYTTNEGYRYTTDSNGRIASAEANLQLGKADRNKYAQRKVGGEDRLSSDDGGHLVASIFKGSGEIDNMVPMDATLNRSEYKVLENTWKKALEEGKTVEVRVEPIYSGDSARPSKFEVEYKIDGKKYEVNLTNYEGGP
ncbi:DNA/RNA non-specific endonuclease [Paenibacillus alkalitolerans]|uniref:DNA/RNA non-specific endonuclease n=1 Tax=Paenibacillus alkalitolerans TaxID=2799335 RepID=UPI001F33D8C0|nr:DNA/RNA non-specific endonuclease [Paenibacillus alkalitolerans]